MENDSKPDKMYTQAEMDAQLKFVNECNARQVKIINALRSELDTLKGTPPCLNISGTR